MTPEFIPPDLREAFCTEAANRGLSLRRAFVQAVSRWTFGPADQDDLSRRGRPRKTRLLEPPEVKAG
jgi:hypothetical protein